MANESSKNIQRAREKILRKFGTLSWEDQSVKSGEYRIA